MNEIRVWEDSETIATYSKRTNSYGEKLWWDVTYTEDEIDEEEGLTLKLLKKNYTLVGEEPADWDGATA
jgi:hypothetical protein